MINVNVRSFVNTDRTHLSGQCMKCVSGQACWFEAEMIYSAVVSGAMVKLFHTSEENKDCDSLLFLF